MKNWLLHLEKDTTPFIVIATNQAGEWTGVAPFCRQTSVTLSKRIRLIGSGKACSDYLGLICKEDNEDQFTTDVATFLQDLANGSTNHSSFNLLELDGIRLDCRRTQKLLQALNSNGFQQTALPLEGSWVAKLPESVDEFRSNMSKSMRRKVKEAAKRLDNESTQVRSTTTDSFEELWPIFVDLHQQRRELLSQAGCFADSNFEHFLKNSTLALIENGLAELTVIEKDECPIASSLSLFNNDKWMLYQTGFDVRFQKESPGYQIVLQAVRTAIKRNFSEFDLLRGDEPYKARWNTDRIELAKVRMTPPTANAWVRNNLWNSAKSLKHFTNNLAAS